RRSRCPTEPPDPSASPYSALPCDAATGIIPRSADAVLAPCRRGGRVVEGAPLLRAYGSKAHRGFESLPLRHMIQAHFSARMVGDAVAPRRRSRASARD